MKPPRFTPTLLAGLIAALAVSLFVRTAISRADHAKTRRIAAEEATRAPAPRREEVPIASGRAQKLPAAGPARDLAIGKRIRAALSIGHSLERTRALLELLKELNGEDFKVALDAYKELFPGNRGDEFKMLSREWGRRDPKAALNYAADDFSLKMEIFDEWSRSHGEAALLWAREEASAEDRSHFIGLAISAMAGRDPQLALDHLEGLGEESVVRSLSSMLYLSGDDATAKVLGWIDGLDDPAQRISAVKIVFNCWRIDHAQEKFDLLLRNPGALEGQGVSLDEAFGTWILADPTAARAALDQLPESPQRSGAIQQSILKLFSEGKVETAMEMVATYPAEGNDRLFQNCVAALSGSDTPRALEHAHLIKDPYTHNQAYAGIMGTWIREEPEAARQWLDRNGLPAGVRGYMQKNGYGKELEAIGSKE